jgi:hypothetical protein
MYKFKTFLSIAIISSTFIFSNPLYAYDAIIKQYSCKDIWKPIETLCTDLGGKTKDGHDCTKWSSNIEKNCTEKE